MFGTCGSEWERKRSERDSWEAGILLCLVLQIERKGSDKEKQSADFNKKGEIN